MKLSFTKEYFPLLEELSDEQIASARSQVVSELQPMLPDVDLTPGTPTGDFIVSVLALYKAGAEESNSRLMSDLDLSNVADGIIYSCEFVRAYLGNFGVYDVENLSATGLVRLTYSSPNYREIPRTSRFKFGTDDAWSLRIVNPVADKMKILSAGSSHTGEADTYTLAQTSAVTWAVDVPLTGVLSEPIVAGTEGTGTEIDEDLVGITSAMDFMSGVPSASLSSLAKMARKVSFSLTAGSRASTKALIYRNWPETSMASPIVPGDSEMQRVAPGSAMAIMAPAIDVYVRSSRDMQRETQNIRLDYVLTEAGDYEFRGLLSLLHRPSRIVSIEWSGSTVSSVVDAYTTYSESTRADLYGCLHCGTRYEAIHVSLTPTKTDDVSDIPISDIEENDVTKQYAIFTVVYDADPLLETISSLLESPDYKPAGVDVLVKSGPLSLIDDMVITYSKQQGVNTTLSTARERINDYILDAGFPDPFRVTAIHDIMRSSGTTRIANISSTGRILVSAADRLFRNTIPDPSGVNVLVDWFAESDNIEYLPFYTTGNAVPNTIIEGEISPGGPLNAWAATQRTTRYAVERIRFIEV